MTSRTLPSLRRARTVVALALAGATTLAATATSVLVAPAQAKDTQADVEMVTANLRSDLSVARFQSDVAEVMAHKPDFVAYNEVPLRQDAVLAPQGYALYRGRTNRYTMATPVAWRTDRWTMVDAGTHKISNYRKVPAGKRVKLGLRYANWVVLRSTEGRQVSVVSMHAAPVFRDGGKTYDLIRPSIRRLGDLVSTLPDGPVFVGGDFNVHYRSGRYPEDLFDAARLSPTYETLGTFPTGDHANGATIDYVFSRGAGQVLPSEHHPHEVYSDHDLVVGGFEWQGDAPQDIQRVVSDPTGGTAERERAVSRVKETIRSVATDGAVDVVSAGLAQPVVRRALRAVLARGAAVRYHTRSAEVTEEERSLRKLIRASTVPGAVFDRCRKDCLKGWKASGMSRTLVMLRNQAGAARLRLDANRTVAGAMVTKRTTVVTQSGDVALSEGDQLLRAIR